MKAVAYCLRNGDGSTDSLVGGKKKMCYDREDEEIEDGKILGRPNEEIDIILDMENDFTEEDE